MASRLRSTALPLSLGLWVDQGGDRYESPLMYRQQESWGATYRPPFKGLFLAG